VSTTLTSCGARHNKHRPLLPPSEWYWLELWPVITNKLTFDPPTRLCELTQNLIRSSHGRPTLSLSPSLKISCKSVQSFSRNVADKETKKETNKQIARKQYPIPLLGRSNKTNSDWLDAAAAAETWATSRTWTNNTLILSSTTHNQTSISISHKIIINIKKL